MKDAIVIARMTFKVLKRKGAVLAVALIMVVLSSLLFFLSRSDGVLVNELEIRLSYSYSLTYAVLSLLIIALACFTVRSQIDAKNLHLVTSHPIKRKWIFTGQALALIMLGIIGEIVLLSSLLINSYFFSKSFPAEQITAAKEKYFIAHRKVVPIYNSKREVTIAYAEKTGKDLTQMDEAEWIILGDEALKKEQLVEPGKKLVWEFDLGEYPSKGETAELIFRFRKKDQVKKVKGFFEFKAEGFNTYYKHEVISERYVYNKFDVPLTSIPENGKFSVVFENTGDEAAYVMRTGIYFNYVSGSLSGSILRAGIAQSLHLAVTVIVGLCAGIALTFSVGSFFVIMLFLASFSQGIFETVWEEYIFKYVVSIWETIAMKFFEVALWATKGLHPPSVISNLSSGLDVSWTYIITVWLPPTLLYAAVGYALGVWALTNKELDKVQT